MRRLRRLKPENVPTLAEIRQLRAEVKQLKAELAKAREELRKHRG